ncbi:MAG: hypothetical protein IPH12_12950 [Saprospirales bacterium]|nr:hypothetical protein [Saprospirales bacterium]MBK8921262.1 hypothetical protein [Saprospirales bacterium]
MDVRWKNLFAGPTVSNWALPALLATGALVRIAVWWQNHSLFLDEANLARNFCERGLFDYFRPLDYDQFAPPLFCMMQKAMTVLFGPNEYALRVFPLVCSLLALYFFYRLARQALTCTWVLAPALWIFCFSDILLRYAAEGKPYGCDAAVALGLVFWLIKPGRPVFATAVIGVVAVWLSMPSVFVLFGGGMVLSLRAWRASGRRAQLELLFPVALWVLSFGLYYTLLLRPSLLVGTLVEYHRQWFFPLPPLDQADWRKAGALLLTFPYYTAGFTVLAKLAGSAGILTGLAIVFRRHTETALLLAAPMLAGVLASGLGQYSLIPRLLVWAFPLALLLQALGWQLWWQHSHRFLLPLLMAVFWVTAGLHLGLRHFVEPYVVEEVRPVLQAIGRDFRPGDVLYVHHEAWPATAYYRDCHAGRDRYQFGRRVIHGNWDERPTLEKVSVSGRQPGRVWLVYSHVVSGQTRASMQADLKAIGAFARQIRAIEQPGARGYCYVLLSAVPQ